MDVQVRHLRAFVAVATLRSFTRASEQLLITQPALTRTIKQLESVLDTVLMDRTTHKVSLTAAGEEFLPYASQVLNDLESGINAVRRHANLRLGFSWLLPDPWAQRAVRRFEDATNVSVSLVRCDDPVSAIGDGRVDVALVRGDTSPEPSMRVVHLFDEHRVAVCAAESELAGVAELAWSEVPDWPLVVNTVSGTTGPWSWADDTSPRTIVTTGNFDEWLEAVAANRGIGVIPDIGQRRAIHPALRFVPLVGAPSSAVSLVFRRDPRARLIRRFVSVALESASRGP